MSDFGESNAPPHATPRLRAAVKPIHEITHADRDQMYALLCESFENVDRQQFESDLNEKQSVVVLTPFGTDAIAGFSTFATLRTFVDNQSIAAIFAGDTLVREPYRGNSIWMRFWLRYALELAEQQPEPDCYGLLLTSTPISYHGLSAFFREFYPSPHAATPPRMQRYLDSLVRLKFSAGYSAQLSTVTPPQPWARRLSSRVWERPRQDSMSDFFVSRNPRFMHGTFLACITPLSRGNLTRYGLRMIA